MAAFEDPRPQSTYDDFYVICLKRGSCGFQANSFYAFRTIPPTFGCHENREHHVVVAESDASLGAMVPSFPVEAHILSRSSPRAEHRMDPLLDMPPLSPILNVNIMRSFTHETHVIFYVELSHFRIFLFILLYTLRRKYFFCRFVQV